MNIFSTVVLVRYNVAFILVKCSQVKEGCTNFGAELRLCFLPLAARGRCVALIQPHAAAALFLCACYLPFSLS